MKYTGYVLIVDPTIKIAVSLKVECTVAQGETGYTHDLAADVYVYTMARLKPQTAYTCHVKARTKKGYGAELEKTFWTLGGKGHINVCMATTSYLPYMILRSRYSTEIHNY